MPGSYPDPRVYANTALNALERAYDNNTDPQTKSLIYTAIEALRRLKQEMAKDGHGAEVSGFDPHDWNESNSAI
jgi:20S proteasome alpha/beta subunit